MLENQILELVINLDDVYLCVMGDLNARTSDYAIFFHEIRVIPEFLNFQYLWQSLSVDRCPYDKGIYNCGVKFLDFCRSYCLSILGRCGSDKNVGHFTYISSSGCSVIDYIMLCGLVDKVFNLCIGTRT